MEYIVLWILALFGAWSLVVNILDSFCTANREGKFEVILNTYNQEDSIQIFINRLSKIELIGKIRVIDNNSTDNTIRIVKEMQKNNPKILIEKA